MKIDWMKVKYEDLRMPLYSGLAARLLLSKEPAIPDGIVEQSEYYEKYYNTTAGVKERFVTEVKKLEALEVNEDLKIIS